MRWRVAMLSAVVLLLAVPGFAQQVDVTPVGGFRVGGSMEDYNSGGDFDIKDDWAFGGMIDVSIPGGRAVELVYSHQGTELEAKGVFPGAPVTAPLDVDLWQVGVLQNKELTPALTGYVVGSLGLTHFAFPSDSESRFSIGFGGGVKAFLNRTVGFRADGRGYVTFVDTDNFYATGGGGGATISFSSDLLLQAEFLGGVVFRFGI